MKLRRAMGLFAALTSAACGDLIPDLPEDADANLPTVDGGTDAGHVSNVDASPDAGVITRTKSGRVVSTAPTYVLVGDSFRYRPKSNTSGQTFALTSAPQGMKMRGQMVEWTPTEQQAGRQRVSLRAIDDESVVQEFDVGVANSTLRAEGDVSGETGGSAFASGPNNERLRGVGVYVPPGGVRADTRVSVSELDQAPPMPNAAGSARALRFGPAGQVFDTPASITLPLPESVSHERRRLSVYVYEPAGRWQRVPIAAIDTENRLVTAKARHFSIYAAIQSSLEIDLALARAGAGSACEGALYGSAALNESSPLSSVALASVNNLPEALSALVGGDAPSVQDLLSAPGFSGSLRAVQVFELLEPEGEIVREQRVVATTLYVPGDGSATITHADAFGNVLAAKRYPQPALELADIARRLRGGATAVRFASEVEDGLGLGARVHLAYFPGDASQDPVSADDLGLAAVESDPVFGLATSAVGDVDCDGLLDGFDPEDDRLLARVEASPLAVANVYGGESVTLRARVLSADVSGSWSVDGAGATLAPVQDAADARSFSASASGRYFVSFRAQAGGRALEHVFAIDVLDRPLVNTPPRCQPSKDIDVGRVGEPVALSAVLRDEESLASALRVEWGLLDPNSDAPSLIPASTLLSRGERALFAPAVAGNYEVGCRAFDGDSYGPVGSLPVSVVSREQNRAPVELTLSPMAATMPVGQSLKLHASARDPDGDALTFTWYIEGGETAGESQGSESWLRVDGAESGVIQVGVSVSDGHTPALHAFTEVLVGERPTGVLDADGDGWPAGEGTLADCNDADPNVHPNASDRCGDDIDADCDGSAQRDDCDYDDFTLAQGDCDDGNPLRHPQASELCDGIDNDCNEAVDESFSVGQACVVGQGACQARGVLACSADGLFALCATSPLLPTEEVCDRADNDCDGEVDEPPACGGSDSGVQDSGVDDAGVPDAGVSDAGTGADAALPEGGADDAGVRDAGSDEAGTGARDAGSAADAGLPVGTDDGGAETDAATTKAPDADIGSGEGGTSSSTSADAGASTTADAGTYDGGAACIPTSEEIYCDGIDNDCNGQIDDVRATCSTGMLGNCAYGTLHCSADGAVCEPNTTPLPEICNQTDDDCDGMIDEDIVCTCDPKAMENCTDQTDNDCDGMVDGADSDCRQSCQTGAVEYCYDQVDNDCDGLVDAADPECCLYEGAEKCDDARDNDCDMLIDGADPECGGVPAGESCQAPEGIELGVWHGGTFDGAKDDVSSSCAPEMADRVYKFAMSKPGDVMVHYAGAQPAAWSIQTGECSAAQQTLREYVCKPGDIFYLPAGIYFLVMEGQAGGYEFAIELAPTDSDGGTTTTTTTTTISGDASLQ